MPFLPPNQQRQHWRSIVVVVVAVVCIILYLGHLKIIWCGWLIESWLNWNVDGGSAHSLMTSCCPRAAKGPDLCVLNLDGKFCSHMWTFKNLMGDSLHLTHGTVVCLKPLSVYVLIEGESATDTLIYAMCCCMLYLMRGLECIIFYFDSLTSLYWFVNGLYLDSCDCSYLWIVTYVNVL